MTALLNSIGPNGITITEPADQTLIKDTAMSTFTLTPSGGTAPYTITEYLGTIPAGTALTMAGDNLSADVTGTPTAAKSAEDITFLIVDADGGAIITAPISFQVADDLTIAAGLDSATEIGATKSTAFEYQLYNSGGRSAFVWTKATGTWSAGLSISSSGLISGTPTATGSQTLTFTVTDANSETATTANLTITVNDVLSVSQSSVAFSEGVPTSLSIVAVGGTEPIYFTLDDGDVLPEGIIMIQDGIRTCVLTGTVPSGASAETLNVMTTDTSGASAETGNFTASVSAPPA